MPEPAQSADASGPSSVVVLTRPHGQNAALAARLAHAGRGVLELPALRLTESGLPAPDPAQFDLVMFVSGNAARMFLQTRYGTDGTWPAGTPAAVVGPSSAAALCGHPAFGPAGMLVQPPASASHFDSEALWAVIDAMPVLPGKVLIVRGGTGIEGSGRDWLAGQLRARGAQVTVHQAYRREPQAWSPQQVAALRALAASRVPTAWLLTSKEGVDAVAAQMVRLDLLAWWRQCRLIATHPRIAQHVIAVLAAQTGHPVAPMLQTCSPQDNDILAAIESAP
jgi:uroporphyrinogen-III synthase